MANKRPFEVKEEVSFDDCDPGYLLSEVEARLAADARSLLEAASSEFEAVRNALRTAKPHQSPMLGERMAALLAKVHAASTTFARDIRYDAMKMCIGFAELPHHVASVIDGGLEAWPDMHFQALYEFVLGASCDATWAPIPTDIERFTRLSLADRLVWGVATLVNRACHRPPQQSHGPDFDVDSRLVTGVRYTSRRFRKLHASHCDGGFVLFKYDNDEFTHSPDAEHLASVFCGNRMMRDGSACGDLLTRVFADGPTDDPLVDKTRKCIARMPVHDMVNAMKATKPALLLSAAAVMMAALLWQDLAKLLILTSGGVCSFTDTPIQFVPGPLRKLRIIDPASGYLRSEAQRVAQGEMSAVYASVKGRLMVDSRIDVKEYAQWCSGEKGEDPFLQGPLAKYADALDAMISEVDEVDVGQIIYKRVDVYGTAWVMASKGTVETLSQFTAAHIAFVMEHRKGFLAETEAAELLRCII